MTMFTSQIHFVKRHRARRRQVRKALQMLSVSGVVRPGHLETRYLAHPIRIDAIYSRTVQTVTVPFDEPSMPSLLNGQLQSNVLESAISSVPSTRQDC
jgi:hypothetical protein